MNNVCLSLIAEEEGLRSKSKKSEGGETTEDMTIPRNSDIEAPPPPQISNPSPPPPPRIYAEDLKRDKRKQDKCNDKLDDKRPRLGEGASLLNQIFLYTLRYFKYKLIYFFLQREQQSRK